MLRIENERGAKAEERGRTENDKVRRKEQIATGISVTGEQVSFILK